MYKLKKTIKRLFTPITLMLVPHTSRKPFSIKAPSIGIFAFIVMGFVGIVYVFSVSVDALQYRVMKEKLNYYTEQFLDLRSTISSLKSAEAEFKRLFSMKTKEEVLEHLNTSDSGSIDMEALKNQINTAIETVSGIKDYMSQERDIYMATPKGMPVYGRITSGFSERVHPITGMIDFHTGIDIASSPDTPIAATADGVVSFSGRSGGSGNLVVIEHGFGYSTLYAHNKRNNVSVGQVVKRGDIVSYVGSTGSTTGPHLHYEVWKNKRATNPAQFIK
ncbi:MAG: M23 family metallopeptidase [Nitrospirae bacterium]|nr:M23 family metallopeptidase [Nitrospirota bacterium]